MRPFSGPGIRRVPADGWLLTIAATGLSGLFLAATYAATDAGIPCLFKAVTGLDCPTCGGTRMGAALLQGDVTAAMATNPLLFGLTLGFGYMYLAWVLERFAIARLPRPSLATPRARRAVGFGLLAVALLFTVGRNLL